MANTHELFKTFDEKITLTIFDEEIEDEKLKIGNISKDEIDAKLNKKTKLFI